MKGRIDPNTIEMAFCRHAYGGPTLALWFFSGSKEPYSFVISKGGGGVRTPGSTGPRSAVGNMSCYRCVSDCRSRGREFDPGPIPYFRGDWSWNNFYGHSPPFRWFIHYQEGLLSVTSESMCTNYWLTACSSLPRKKVRLGELTVPQWP